MNNFLIFFILFWILEKGICVSESIAKSCEEREYSPSYQNTSPESLLQEAGETDKFLGYTKMKLQSTGFFRLERNNDKHFLVTPTGHPYLPLSVCHLPGVNRQKISADKIIRNLREWNYNAVGYGIADEMKTLIPYFYEIYIIGPSKPSAVNKSTVPSPQFRFHDIFDPEVVAWNEKIIRDVCNTHNNDPFLIGYYFMDIPVWYIDHARVLSGIDYPSFIKRLPEKAPGKIVYVEFLRKMYMDNITSLNRSYNTSFNSFDEILGYNFPEFSEKGTREYDDDIAFQGLIADQYYSTSCSLVRKFDHNHLIFGDRLKMRPAPPFITDEHVLKAAAKYVDVISTEATFNGNFDGQTEKNYREMYRITNKPIMIDDHDVMNIDYNIPDSAYYSQRARLTGEYVRKAFSTGFIIGHSKCQYFDRPGEKIPRGIVNPDNSPRNDYINIIRKLNELNLKQAYEDVLNEY